MRTLDPEHVAQLGKDLTGLREFALFQFTSADGYYFNPDGVPSYSPYPARSYDEMKEMVGWMISALDYFIVDYLNFEELWFEISWAGPPPLYAWYYVALEWRYLIAGTPHPEPPLTGQVVNVRVLPKKWS